MCGFAGFLTRRNSSSAAEMCAVARKMNLEIAHRGPDDSGEWADPATGIAFGFRRLSIIDLSEAGHQPMQSASGRYMIMFNGEVYNFRRIVAELEAVRGPIEWRGHSDSEVILAAVEQWGLIGAVRRFIGMFAFSLWDRQERELHLVRDRVGVKPLYYGWANDDVLLFGSELKAFEAFPGFSPEVDQQAVAALLAYAYIPAPQTIYKSFRKLKSGAIATFRTGSLGEPKITTYWDAAEVVSNARQRMFHGNDQEATDQLETLLMDAVGLRMVSDVPLGVFLSGGIDSSVVTALMQRQSAVPVKTFSIGLAEREWDEAESAAAVARHLGTDHTALTVTPREALDIVPLIPGMFAEPFADSSQIPTYLVSKLARQSVTVALSGDGGDELFGGYNRYFLAGRLWRKTNRLPGFAKSLAAGAINSLSPDRWNRIWGAASPLMPKLYRQRQPGEKLIKFARMLGARTPEQLYETLVTFWRDEPVVRGTSLAARDVRTELTDPVDYMMFLDMLTYMQDDILVKVDRASMAVSLEAREPLLDHRLIEFAWALPQSMKIRNGEGKWLLKQVLYRHVPRELVDRPKMGFSIPLDLWLRGPLRDWAENLLDERRLRETVFLDPAPIRRAWSEHLSGRRNRQYELWPVLMLQAWLDSTQQRACAASAQAVAEAVPRG
ncbi:MAG TPA: asparagine synthase (glutamine-hydrolyzing) [Thermoanaerobaculia bacterium]